MTREDMHDLILGVALIALGYAVYQHHKAANSRGTNTGIMPPIAVPAPPAIQGDSSTGYWYDLDNLLAGVTS